MKFILENEDLDEKTKQNMTCAFDYISSKEGELKGGGGGGSQVGYIYIYIYILAVSPFLTFLKVYFDSRKALLVLLCKLKCFAVCWELKLCLTIIYKLKKGKGGNLETQPS